MNNDYLNAARGIKIGNPTGKSVLLLLADLSRRHKGFCWPTENWIANALELSPSAVRKWLAVLVERKIILKTKLSGKRWKRNGYQMNFDPNQTYFDFEYDDEQSPPRDSGDKPQSAPPGSGENSKSAPPRSGDKNRQRHQVAVSAPPGVSDTAWRLTISNKESFKPLKNSTETHINAHEAQPEVATDTPEWAWPMKPLVDAFPEYLVDGGRITPTMIGFVEADVKPGDEEAWDKTIEKYRMNFDPMLKRYLPDKIGNLIDLFRKMKAELEIGANDRNGRKTSSSPAQSASHEARIERTRQVIDDANKRFHRPKLNT